MKQQLALLVLLASVSMWECRDGLESLIRHWLPAFYERRLEPLVRMLPLVRLEANDGIRVRVLRGRAKDI